MKEVQLTDNFKLSEFTKNELNPYQLSLIKRLAQELQWLRNKLNWVDKYKKVKSKPITMTITSGVRTLKDYERLVSEGYNPSKSSDHFCGVQMEGKPTLGAADVVFGNLGITYNELFKDIVAMCESGDIAFGQIILEYNPKTKNYWIHFGNDPYRIFGTGSVPDAINSMRVKYLTSKNNGKSYTEYKL